MWINADNRLIRELKEAGFDMDYRLLLTLYRASRKRPKVELVQQPASSPPLTRDPAAPDSAMLQRAER